MFIKSLSSTQSRNLGDNIIHFGLLTSMQDIMAFCRTSGKLLHSSAILGHKNKKHIKEIILQIYDVQQNC